MRWCTIGLQWLEDFASTHKKPTAYPEWGVNFDRAGPYIERAAQWFSGHNVLYQSVWNSNDAFPGKLTDHSIPRQRPPTSTLSEQQLPTNVRASGGPLWKPSYELWKLRPEMHGK